MPKYCGLYKGTVVNNQDPNSQMRIVAKVPQLFGPTGQTGWALPCYPLALVAPPKMGDPVWIMFESGDEDHPVYTGAWSSWDTQIAEATVENLPGDLSTIDAHLTTIDSEITAINNGTSGLPATTVTGPDAFGDAASVGTSIMYARADHNHGLPAVPMPGQELGYTELTGGTQTFDCDGNDHDIGVSLPITMTAKFVIEAEVWISTPTPQLQWVDLRIYDSGGTMITSNNQYPSIGGNWLTLRAKGRLPRTGYSVTTGSALTIKLRVAMPSSAGNTFGVLGPTTSGNTLMSWLRVVAC